MPCKKGAMNFKKRHSGENYFQITASAVWFNVFQRNFVHLFSGPCLLSRINPQGFAEYFGDSVIQSLKRGKTQKSGLVPISRQEKLAVVFPARLET